MRILAFQYFFFLFSVLSIVNATALNPSVTGVVGIYNFMSYNVFSFPDFWEEAKKLGDKATKYANEQIELAASNDTSIAEGIHDFQATWRHVVTAIGELRPVPNSHFQLEQRGLEDFAEFFSTNMEKISERLQAELELPLPESQSERYKQRELIINTTLNMTEDVLVEAHNILHLTEEEVREKFGNVKPHICHSILVMGNLADNHPYIVEAIAFSAIIMIMPEGSILRPIARVFGISPVGPVKGSPAALAQRFFFGHTIPAKSWFSRLQQAGMRKGGLFDGLKAIFCRFFRFC